MKKYERLVAILGIIGALVLMYLVLSVPVFPR